MDRFTKLYFVDREFDTKLTQLSVELFHEGEERTFCSPPQTNAVVDESCPETDCLDQIKFWRHLYE